MSCPRVLDGTAARALGTVLRLGAASPWLVICGSTPRPGQCFGSLSLTQLLDALLVLDEQLDPGDVNVEPWALGWPFHRGVKAAVVLAVGRRTAGGWLSSHKGLGEGALQDRGS